MLADYQIIAQILTQLCSLVLLGIGVIFGLRMLRFWSAASPDSLQLDLERQTYLLSAIVQFVLLFQVATLLMFLHTANNHLTGILKGAMCATGSLSINNFGYMALYLKMGAILVYALFLMLNYLDNSEPAYPLSPLKYWMLFPAFFILSLDTLWTIQYFWHIKPDIIATCCSVDFVASNLPFYTQNLQKSSNSQTLFFFALSFSLLLFLQLWVLLKNLPSTNRLFITTFQFLLSLVFVASAVYTLKYFFVKYIYGLPSHTCLFDIFWAKYNYVGYILFGAYYGLLLSSLFQMIYAFFEKRLNAKHSKLLYQTGVWNLIFLSLAFFLPLLYWYFWKGDL